MTMETRILTYGTYDTLHYGHVRLLQRAKALGDKLYVGLSTDEFNSLKGKQAVFSFEERKTLLLALRCVDYVFPEETWEQKLDDVRTHSISTFVMGDDWAGKFDHLGHACNVIYLSRTPDISSTAIRSLLPQPSKE